MWKIVLEAMPSEMRGTLEKNVCAFNHDIGSLVECLRRECSGTASMLKDVAVGVDFRDLLVRYFNSEFGEPDLSMHQISQGQATLLQDEDDGDGDADELLSIIACFELDEDEEDAVVTGDVVATSVVVATSGMEAQVLCRNFAETGFCKFGSDCRFFHPLTAALAVAVSAPKKPCSNWAAGNCRFGAACHFSHIHPVAGGGAARPCVNWMSGSCTFGAKCRYSHGGS
jgi:hypothetical protein